MSGPWRLLVEGPLDGAWNMALDRAIQLEHAEGEVPPTLRLYRWGRPTVTLGRFQDSAGVDWDAVDEYGVDVVRRFTGGRGVLHDDELTYSIVAGERDGVPRGVSASYRLLCTALAGAYRALGVEAELTSRPRGERGSSACYLHATHADLSLGAAKLSGSAQVWHARTCLQHGSFTRSRDLAREAAVFGLDKHAAEKLAASTATLAEVTDPVPGPDRIVSAVVDAVGTVFGTRLEPGGPTQAEQERARELLGDVRVARLAGR